MEAIAKNAGKETNCPGISEADKKKKKRVGTKKGKTISRVQEVEQILETKPDERIPADHPFELVAATAASLLKDDDYPSAVRRALALLEECDNQLGANRDLTREREARIRRQMREYEPPRVSLSQAAVEITGQKNSTRARKQFFEWLKSALPGAFLTEEDQSIDQADVRRYKRLFEEDRDRKIKTKMGNESLAARARALRK